MIPATGKTGDGGLRIAVHPARADDAVPAPDAVGDCGGPGDRQASSLFSGRGA